MKICHTLRKGLLSTPCTGVIRENNYKLFSTTNKTNANDISEKVLVKAIWAAIYHKKIV